MQTNIASSGPTDKPRAVRFFATNCAGGQRAYNLVMSIYDGLKDAAKVLREADKIEQYKEIIAAMEKLLELHARVAELEAENTELKQ